MSYIRKVMTPEEAEQLRAEAAEMRKRLERRGLCAQCRAPGVVPPESHAKCLIAAALLAAADEAHRFADRCDAKARKEEWHAHAVRLEGSSEAFRLFAAYLRRKAGAL